MEIALLTTQESAVDRLSHTVYMNHRYGMLNSIKQISYVGIRYVLNQKGPYSQPRRKVWGILGAQAPPESFQRGLGYPWGKQDVCADTHTQLALLQATPRGGPVQHASKTCRSNMPQKHASSALILINPQGF